MTHDPDTRAVPATGRSDRSPPVSSTAMAETLRAFEARERERLGLDPAPEQWHDPNPQQFTRAERAHTTVLFGGLTTLHDKLIEAGLGALGYRAEALPCPDGGSLQIGKEFGNRGQCNPTYFTVGNLVGYLQRLRDRDGLSAEEIVRRYVFVTASACGPCRFGMYVTEYRKALRDAGFAGFRVLTFQNSGSGDTAVEEAGLEFNREFFVTLVKTIIAADVLNAMGYRLRPYELEPGSTDAALRECQRIVARALADRTSVLRALRDCRRTLARVAVNWLQPKPKVSIIGEFWAMTTEGDGNYRLQRFLESEGAECDVQLVTGWLLYSLWQVRYDARQRMRIPHLDRREFRGLVKRLALAGAVQFLISSTFRVFARNAGLVGYHLPDMDELAELSHGYYLNQLRGGEGHMEVGKVIQAATKNKAHLVISVKPFGCMPSSGVSDGVQSVVLNHYPDAEFLPIETSGDGAVNVHSRVQMALHKAKRRAESEFDRALAQAGVDRTQASVALSTDRRAASAVRYPRHTVAGTAANAVFEMG